MYFEVFNSMFFDDEMNLLSCLENDYARAAMTFEEMTKIVPKVKKIMECESLDEILTVTDYFIDDLPLPIEVQERWLKSGLNEFERYCVAFLYFTAQLEISRYHLCQFCGEVYFLTDDISDICDKCADRYTHI